MARMEAGSLVVPRPVAWMMKHYPGRFKLERKKPMHQLDPVVVMPNEYAIPKEHANAVELWLKEHGITLPIPKNWDVKRKMRPRRKCSDDRCEICN